MERIKETLKKIKVDMIVVTRFGADNTLVECDKFNDIEWDADSLYYYCTDIENTYRENGVYLIDNVRRAYHEYNEVMSKYRELSQTYIVDDIERELLNGEFDRLTGLGEGVSGNHTLSKLTKLLIVDDLEIKLSDFCEAYDDVNLDDECVIWINRVENTLEGGWDMITPHEAKSLRNYWNTQADEYICNLKLNYL